MVKKALLSIVVIIFVIATCSCGFLSSKESANVSETEQKEDDFDTVDVEAGFSYLDPNIDMSLLIAAPGWRYQKDEEAGMVIFYMPEEYDGLTSFAISSNTKKGNGMSDNDLDSVIDQMGYESNEIVESFVTSVDWKEVDSIKAGNYTARRFSYTGKLKSSDENVHGDYFFWWTKDRLYTCSSVTFEDIYEEYYLILKEALLTFKTYDEIS